MTDPVSCRELVVLAAKAAGDAITSVADLSVERDRTDPLEEGDLPRAVLVEGAEEVHFDFTGQDNYALPVEWQLYARNAAELAAMRAAFLRRMLTDIALMDLCIRVTDGGEGEPGLLAFTHFGDRAKAATRVFIVEYATLENDPYTFA